MGQGNRRQRALGECAGRGRFVLGEYRRRREVRVGDGRSPINGELRNL
jgi:hypothetical protein